MLKRFAAVLRQHAGLSILALLTAVLVLLTQFLIPPPAWVDAVYSRKVYVWVDALLRGVSDQVGLSLTEFGLIALLIAGFWALLRRVRRRKSWRSLILRAAVLLSICYIWFHVAWGLNYYRRPLIQQLGLENGKVPPQVFVQLGEEFVRRTNVLRPDSALASRETIAADIDRVYPAVLRELGLAPAIKPSRVKRLSLLNGLLNKTQTSGFFSPFFHEVHVNADLLLPELPFVIAHERAHQLGYASEAEASFLAHLVCARANLPISRYSGYFRVIGRVLASIPDRETQRALWNSLRPAVRDDFAAVRRRILKHAGAIARLSQRGYDVYLRSNRIAEGVQNYARVADLLALYYVQQEGAMGGNSLGP